MYVLFTESDLCSYQSPWQNENNANDLFFLKLNKSIVFKYSYYIYLIFTRYIILYKYK